MSNKILLCVSDTGGGHKSAAIAIRSAIEEIEEADNPKGKTRQVVIVDVVENSSSLHRIFVALYNYLLRHRQDWMKYYYRLIEVTKPDNSSVGYWLASGYVKRLLSELNPAIVVSIHPMANHYLARAMSEISLPHQPKLIEVITDPNADLWTGWACRDANLIVAPNEPTRQKLVDLGIEPAKIVTIGMPVNPKFLKPAVKSREQYLQDLNLNPNLVTVCLTAGWAGGGNFKEIYRALSEVEKPIQVIAICGKNELLLAETRKMAQAMKFQTLAVAEIESLSDAMNACDLLVTKAGGLTTYEAAARRLPMAIDMLTPPMPQEQGTAQMLIETGLASPIKRPADVVAIVESVKHIENRNLLALPTKYNLNRTDAVYEIARLILSNCNPDH